VLISPARNLRPGGSIAGAAETTCPLCPGGAELPWPFEVAVFDNRFPSLVPDAVDPPDPLAGPSRGRCQVVVYTPDHRSASLTELSTGQLVELVAVLRERTSALWDEGFDYVMAFENRGVEVGATLAHLHGQIYALGHLPATIRTKLEQHTRHRAAGDGCLGCTLVGDDLAGDRVLAVTDGFTAAVPYAPRWPFEVHVRARRHGAGRLADLDAGEIVDLARTLDAVVARYDGLYGKALPYMMCVQESPAGAAGDWHLHVEFFPPHRGADRLKIRASVETALDVFINDTVPEETAARLAAVPVPARSWDGVALPEFRDAR
jgi:UDPglucose--hexose-1-phosphate uridylyltransferase